MSGTAVTIGEYEYTLDAKHRLVVPPAFRDALTAEGETRFYLAQGFDNCIWMLRPSQWHQMLLDFKENSKKIADANKVRALKRAIFGRAIDVTLDEQGRVLVPQNLVDHADLKKDVVIIGTGDKAEIWDRRAWKKHSTEQVQPSMEELAKEINL
ncbi:MAG TPA: division/cell wall cluster transcriptional repressor MraZ [Elusimicrobia bacterium]|nr:division/cell wall cluster transcriptional repressor MraZ [Elusimicrobiota bacterium]